MSKMIEVPVTFTADITLTQEVIICVPAHFSTNKEKIREAIIEVIKEDLLADGLLNRDIVSIHVKSFETEE